MEKISVNPISGDVVFETPSLNGNVSKAKKNIELLGYTIKAENTENQRSPVKSFSLRTCRNFGSAFPLPRC
jgi:hypothetical protein